MAKVALILSLPILMHTVAVNAKLLARTTKCRSTLNELVTCKPRVKVKSNRDYVNM